MKWVLGYLAALCVLALIVCQSVAFPTFFTSFYKYEYGKNKTAETIRVEENELMKVTAHLLDYMRGKKSDLVVYAAVDGETREFFNEKEKDHMVDVKNLFDAGFKVRNVSFWLFLLLLLIMIFFKMKILFILARCCREVITGFLLIAAILVVIVALDFNRAFNVFHMLFFTNDLWILDPNTDLLVNIVPLHFFMDIALFIGILLITLSLAVIAVSTIYLRNADRRERY